MDKDLIIKLFKEYYGETFDLFGLSLYLTDVQKEYNSYDFFFNFDNPNKIPYFYSIIADKVDEIVSDFSKYISIETTRSMINFKEDQPRIYLNKDLKNKVKKSFNDVKFLEFYVWIGNSDVSSKFMLYGESVGVKLYWDSDSYNITNKFKPTRATLDGEDIEISKVIKYYDEFLSDKETYWESENVYSKIDSVFLESDYPLLVDNNWIAIYFDTEFH